MFSWLRGEEVLHRVFQLFFFSPRAPGDKVIKQFVFPLWGWCGKVGFFFTICNIILLKGNQILLSLDSFSKKLLCMGCCRTLWGGNRGRNSSCFLCFPIVFENKMFALFPAYSILVLECSVIRHWTLLIVFHNSRSIPSLYLCHWNISNCLIPDYG